MVMPGGWHVIPPVVDVPQLPSLDGTLEGLYLAVERYRTDNGRPVGDVRREVDSQICSRYPHWCGGVVESSVVVRAAHEPTPVDLMIDDVVRWAQEMAKNQAILLVPEEVAERRAERCWDCPMARQWSGGCPTCVENAERQTAQVRNARDTRLAKTLGGCDLHRFDCRTAVHLDRQLLGEAHLDAPAFCWMRPQP